MKDRIQMMNCERSDAGWWRYGLLWLLTVLLIMACQDWRMSDQQDIPRLTDFQPTNPTPIRRLALVTDRQSGRNPAGYPKKKMEYLSQYDKPFTLVLQFVERTKKNYLKQYDEVKRDISEFINGLVTNSDKVRTVGVEK